MKALSIRQPWASLIVNGHKDIENRDWPTKYRGPVLIHTGKAFDTDGYAYKTDVGWESNSGLYWLPNRLRNQYQYYDSLLPHISDLEKELGGIVGYAEIVDCVSRSDSRWFVGDYGFVLKNARPLPFISLRGKLGLFEVPEEIVQQLGL